MMIVVRALAKTSGMALILMLAGACGDSGDGPEESIEGVYKVASHTRSLGDCAKEGAPFDGDTLFKLSKKDGVLRYQTCELADTCHDPDPSRQFKQRDGAEWTGIKASATKRRETCNAQLAERVASPLNGDNIQIEVRQYTGEFAREEGQDCDEALIIANRDALSCHQRDIIKATLFEAP
ncbi:hypothetical protein DFR33_102206 [Bradymonas sediminis]|nr:hypothetical protein DFR33_102206 [Bradymonas sediminis]